MAAEASDGIKIPRELLQRAVAALEGNSAVVLKNWEVMPNKSHIVPIDLSSYIANVYYSTEGEMSTHHIRFYIKAERTSSAIEFLKKEEFIYNTLLREFDKQSLHYKNTMKSKRQMFLSKESRMDGEGSPVIFRGKDEAFHFLFLKDLQENENYFSVDEAKELDFNHALLAVEILARFHANSYFYKKQSAKTQGKSSVTSLQLLAKFPFTKETFFTSGNSLLMTKIYEECHELVCKIVENENPTLGMKLRRKISGHAIFERLKTILENEKYENSDLYVFCHGDFSVKNLLFKYSQSSEQNVGDREPLECKMINYESLRYAPLASDLAYFLSTCTDGKTRLEFEEKLIAHYCDTFENEMVEKLGFPQNEFDIEEFHRKVEEQYYGRMMEFGFFSSYLELPLMILRGTSSELTFSNLGLTTQEKIALVINVLRENTLTNKKLQTRLVDNVKLLVKKGFL